MPRLLIGVSYGNESLVSAPAVRVADRHRGKDIEWRSKPFNWRGPLVICASKSAIIELDNGKRLPVGVALGIVDVVGCRPMTRKDFVAACSEDYEDEMYGFAWELVSPREVVPVPVKGIVAPRPFGEARN